MRMILDKHNYKPSDSLPQQLLTDGSNTTRGRGMGATFDELNLPPALVRQLFADMIYFDVKPNKAITRFFLTEIAKESKVGVEPETEGPESINQDQPDATTEKIESGTDQSGFLLPPPMDLNALFELCDVHWEVFDIDIMADFLHFATVVQASNPYVVGADADLPHNILTRIASDQPDMLSSPHVVEKVCLPSYILS